MKLNELTNRMTLLYHGNKLGKGINFVALENALNSKNYASMFKFFSEVFDPELYSEKALKDLRNLLFEFDGINLDVLFNLVKYYSSRSENEESFFNTLGALKYLLKEEHIDTENNLEHSKKLNHLLYALVDKSKIDESTHLFGSMFGGSDYLFGSLCKLLDEPSANFIDSIRKVYARFYNGYLSQSIDDAFSRGQLQSKLWLVDTVNSLDLKLGDMVYVCAGWYGVLPALMFERASDKFERIVSFDIDPNTPIVADTLNKQHIISGVYRPFEYDIHKLKYKNDSFMGHSFAYKDLKTCEKKEVPYNNLWASCVINTSCEHIENFDEWWANVPEGMLVILQNNDFVEHDDQTVVNTQLSADEFAVRLGFKPRSKTHPRRNDDKLKDPLYVGTLRLENYKRFMVIGRK